MKCKLCLEEKPLVKAHIIPDFIYKNLELYEPDKKGQGRVHVGIVRNNKFSYNSKGLPTGIYDRDILCADCDGKIIGAYEDYAKKVLSRYFMDLDKVSFDKVFDAELRRNYLVQRGVDYAKFKLFLLSIFWRGSVSCHGFSSEIDLGVERNEIIRKMILYGDPMEPEDFCSILWYMNDRIVHKTFLTNFKRSQEFNSSYSFVVGNLLFCFFSNRNDIPAFLGSCVLSYDGDLKMLELPEELIKPTLNSFIGSTYF